MRPRAHGGGSAKCQYWWMELDVVLIPEAEARFMPSITGGGHARELMRSLCVLAAANVELMRLRKAGEWVRRLEALRSAHPVADAGFHMEVLVTLGNVAYQRGELEKAARLLEEARVRAFSWLNLAGAYRLMKRLGDSIAYYRKGLAPAEEFSGKGDTTLSNDYQNFAAVLRKARNKREAREYESLARRPVRPHRGRGGMEPRKTQDFYPLTSATGCPDSPGTPAGIPVHTMSKMMLCPWASSVCSPTSLRWWTRDSNRRFHARLPRG